MSNVVAYVRSRSIHRRARSSLDNRSGNLRRLALAEEEEDIVVSSPKDKNFSSLPWDILKERTSLEFSPSATPVSDGPRTPTSAEYANFQKPYNFEQAKSGSSSTQYKRHQRAMSTPIMTSQEVPSAGQKPSVLQKRRQMPISKSEPSPQTGSFPTINELKELSLPPDTQKPLPPEPQSHSRPRPDSTTLGIHPKQSPRSVDILEHHSQILQQQEQHCQTFSLPRNQHTSQPPHPSIPQPQTLKQSLPPLNSQPLTTTTKFSKPTHIDLPPPPSMRRLNLPSELHIHTPEYTDALKQWFPAMATAPSRKDAGAKNVARVSVATTTTTVCH